MGLAPPASAKVPWTVRRKSTVLNVLIGDQIVENALRNGESRFWPGSYVVHDVAFVDEVPGQVGDPESHGAVPEACDQNPAGIGTEGQGSGRSAADRGSGAVVLQQTEFHQLADPLCHDVAAETGEAGNLRSGRCRVGSHVVHDRGK